MPLKQDHDARPPTDYRRTRRKQDRNLLYLVIFGSIIAFWAYLTLIGRIGAGRAGYANLIFPLVALLISTVLEGYTWTATAVTGLGLVLVGNWLVMRAARA